jgi:hypothetical protein
VADGPPLEDEPDEELDAPPDELPDEELLLEEEPLDEAFDELPPPHPTRPALHSRATRTLSSRFRMHAPSSTGLHNV